MNWRNDSNLEVFRKYTSVYRCDRDGAITSAVSLRSLPGILSCPADLGVLIVESNLFNLS